MGAKKIDYFKTFFNVAINLLVTAWLFLFFVLEIGEFIYSMKNSDGSITQTIPLLSTLGIIAWVGLIIRKKWGLFCFQGYITFTIMYQLVDLFFNFGWATVAQISITLAIFTFLYFHYKKSRGLIWVVRGFNDAKI